MPVGSLGSITCGKGHIHPPWNRSRVLPIAKWETLCGFCLKETKTAANLRKACSGLSHAAIHIKNERLDLTIAEGTSGRGRLEMPVHKSKRKRTMSITEEEIDNSDGADLGSPPPYSQDQLSWSISTTNSSPRHPSNQSQRSSSTGTTSYSTHIDMVPYSRENTSHNHVQISSTILSDPYQHLRDANIPTKTAWVAIPASEGFRILNLCRSMSQTSSSPPSTSSSESHSSVSELQVPCYNRETLFDDEWQEHMKDVHGVYLVWPQTWMRRIEVVDLDPLGGDIAVCNDIIMSSNHYS
ncbi:hypothetical protein F5884DRAFT_737089 [Xylogone sp. PMI_703]|nr:hypothetical protein F5884DRAFT_737089 [Xylogone sp. PMI_703]